MATFISYPGIDKILEFSYSCEHGVTPGILELKIIPQGASFPFIGDFKARFGNRFLEVKNCRVAEGTFEINDGGQIVSLKLYDGRWPWLFGTIFGSYNRRDDRKRVIESSKRTPQELAEILLDTMKVDRYNVGALPNEEEITVDWDGSNPALELAALVERLGCHVVWNMDGVVSIQKVGTGSTLPTHTQQTVLKDDTTIDVQDVPRAVLFAGGPSEFQYKFNTRAVGIDRDGSVKLINDLSYKPIRGWGKQNDVFGDITDKDDLKLALKSIWRMYQIYIDPEATPVIQGIGRIEELDQILPIFNHKVETFRELSGEQKRKKAAFWGKFWKGNIGKPLNYTENTDVPYDWNIDTRLGIVEISKPIKSWNEDREEWEQAQMGFEVGFHFRDLKTGAHHRFTKERSTGINVRTGPELVKDEETVFRWIWVFDKTNRRLPFWSDNESRTKCNQSADHYLSYAMNKYAATEAKDVVYEGLVLKQLDGAVSQIAWTFNSTSGFETRMCRNTERFPFVPSYKRRRQFEQMKAVLRKVH